MKVKIMKIMALAIAPMALSFIGCDKQITGIGGVEEQPEIGVVINNAESTETTITAEFKPQKDVGKFTVAIGKEGDLPDFEEGTLAGIRTFANNAAQRITFTDLEPDVEYTLFARGENAEQKSTTTVYAIKTKAEQEPPTPPRPDLDLATGVNAESSQYKLHVQYTWEKDVSQMRIYNYIFDVDKLSLEQVKEKLAAGELVEPWSVEGQAQELTYVIPDLSPNNTYIILTQGLSKEIDGVVYAGDITETWCYTNPLTPANLSVDGRIVSIERTNDPNVFNFHFIFTPGADVKNWNVTLQSERWANNNPDHEIMYRLGTDLFLILFHGTDVPREEIKEWTVAADATKVVLCFATYDAEGNSYYCQSEPMPLPGR
jgi:hypothetical protein